MPSALSWPGSQSLDDQSIPRLDLDPKSPDRLPAGWRIWKALTEGPGYREVVHTAPTAYRADLNWRFDEPITPVADLVDSNDHIVGWVGARVANIEHQSAVASEGLEVAMLSPPVIHAFTVSICTSCWRSVIQPATAAKTAAEALHIPVRRSQNPGALKVATMSSQFISAPRARPAGGAEWSFVRSSRRS